MRRWIILGFLALAFHTAGAPSASESRPGTGRPAGPAAVPMGPAMQRMRWIVDTTVGAYDAAGMRDPKWDALARRTLEAAGRTWGRSPRHNGDEDLVVMYSSDAAIHAGCRDPLVIYARARSITFYRATPAEVVKLQKGMADAFRASKYPAIRKCYGMLRAAQVEVQAAPNDEKVRAAAHALVEEAMTYLPEAFADPSLPRMELASSLDVIGDVSETVENDRLVLRDRALDLMEKSVQPKQGLLFAKASMAIHDGWRARGGGFANAVPAEGWKILEQRMAEGLDLLQQAWKIDPTDFETAELLLTAETHASHGREAMEARFSAATRIDPDDFRPYHTKLNWLEPKWHGSAEDLLAFGRECAATGRWSGLVPLVLVDAHWAVGRYGGAGYPPAPHREYFANDPKIWQEIKPIYDRYLQEPDASDFHKTRYAVIAAYSGRWKEANDLFTDMRKHGHPHPAVLYDNEALDALMKEASREAAKQADKDRAARAAAGTLPPTDHILTARWGNEKKWVDCTSKVKDWLCDDAEVWAENDTVGTDPTPQKKKRLEITFIKDGKTQIITVDENKKVPLAELKP